MDLPRPKIDQDGEVADLTDMDPATFKPLSALPSGLQGKLRGRPKAPVTKERITIRLSPEVVSSFRSSGEGWQTKIDQALKDWLKTNKVA
jgi:uncharacterized protein (DUF4415 family)